jgi:phosphatidylglycerol:prolipoprotein diacylglycerol transferase
MSFHGGLLGVVVAGVTFCAWRRMRTLAFADLIFCAAPIGLFLGRIANFINGELVGRPADVAWAMASAAATCRATPASCMRRGSRASCCSAS